MSMPVQRATTMGPCEIDAPLGAGGMAEVYTARETRPDRTVAVTGRIRDAGVPAICCALVAAVLSVGTAQAGQRALDAVPPARSQTVAVLPFVNLSRAESDRWIGEGIAETLASDLQRAPGVTVLYSEALGLALQASTAVDVDVVDEAAALRLCRELGATWLVAGGYQRVGDRLRITTRLIAVETGAVVHAVKVDGTLGELFALQDRVADALGAKLGTAHDLSRRATRDDTDQLAPRAPPLSPPVRPPTSSPAVPGAGSSPAVSATAAVIPAGGFAVPTRVIDGPPPPPPPDTIARDATGRAAIRAVRVTDPLSIDGTLDERVYQNVPAISDFIQVEPVAGAPATEQTEAWVLFDTDHIYISFRCWDSAPESRWIANEMRRDSFGVFQNENIGIMLDTFYDRRNGIVLNINPLGGRMDGQITDESNYNSDWNMVWEVETGRFENGWTVEVALPFKSLRYRPGRTQVWGINLLRAVRWKNELSFVIPTPAALGQSGLLHSSLAATLVGLEAPEGHRTLEIKPYAITDLTSDRQATPPVANELGGNVGLDVKFGVTQNLAVDLTVNTDFAQVEADQQQVNLTRFSLFFPEKREFFLENQGVFAFGGAGAGPFGGGGDTPVLFYSRQIGINKGQEVPIDAGGRLTGRIGKFSVGALHIQTADEPRSGAKTTDFSVVRVKRNLFRRSSIGAIFTERSLSALGTGSSEAYGLDGTFAFYDNLSFDTYWAQTRTPGRRDDDISYRTKLDYGGDRYGIAVERLVVGDNFNPEVGFLRRDDFERSFGSFRFSPRPRSIAAIRKLTWEGQLEYITDRAGVLETHQVQGQFGIEFENSDQFTATYTRQYELLDAPFGIASDVTIPVGGYRFEDVQLSLALGTQRPLSGGLSVQHGTFFSGHKTSVGFGLGGRSRGGRLELTPQLSVEPSVSFNRVDLPEGRFTTQLVTTRTTFTVTPLMFVSALLQYNSSNRSVGANLRLRWEYQPGSELFIVYNEQRDTLVPRFPELENRSFVIKINRFFRF